ncbi:MAG: hypothetical protein ABI723_02330 [Bacteroidia bacterium]
MSTKELVERLESLDEESRIIAEKQIKEILDRAGQVKPKMRAKAGFAKGFFENIPDADEFNKPLDDFKDYM